MRFGRGRSGLGGLGRRAGGPAPGEQNSSSEGAIVLPDHQRVAHSLTQATPVFDVLGAQLGQVVKITEDATLSFLDHVRQADHATAELMSEATQLDDLTSGQTEEIRTVTRSTTEVIDQMVEFVLRRDETVAQLADEVRALSQFVGSIQTIARSTTMLALNAKIEAGRAGEHGVGFQVVADEVRELSRQSDTAARDIGQRIENLARKLADGLADQGGDGAGIHDVASRLQHVADEQREMVTRLDTTTERVRMAVHELATHSASVHELTTSMTAGMQFQDITRQSVEHVVDALSHLGEQFGAFVAVLTGNGDASRLAELGDTMERLRENYVSHHQRAVHHAVAGDSDGGPPVVDNEPAIELF